MLLILLLFVPGLMAAMYHLKLDKKAFKSLDLILWFFIYSFLINGMIICLAYLRGNGFNELPNLYNTINTAAKYFLSALLGAILLPNIMFLFTTAGAWLDRLLKRSKTDE